MSKDKKVTINDVAKYANVSRQTVSRAINNQKDISKETKQRVYKAIKALEYVPNNAARALSSGKSHLIGVISFGAMEYGPEQTLQAIEKGARKYDISVMASSLDNDDIKSKSAIKDVIWQMVGKGVELIVIIPPFADALKALKKIEVKIPILICQDVMEDSFLKRKNVFNISANQKQVVTLGMDEIIKNGYKNILHLAGPNHWYDAILRKTYIDEYFKVHQSQINQIINLQMPSWSSIDAYHICIKFFKSHFEKLMNSNGINSNDSRTAIFASNDLIAIGATRALNELKISIPSEVGVIGIDNFKGSDCLFPPLTTIDQSFYSLGEHCVEYVMAIIHNQIDNISSFKDLLIVPKLIKRNSL